MSWLRTLLAALLLALSPTVATAQNSTAPATAEAEAAGWVVLPGGYVTPESGVVMTASVLRYFQSPGSRTSKVTGAVNAGVNGDVSATIRPSLSLHHDRYRLEGSLYAGRQSKLFYGVGNDSAVADEERFQRGILSLELTFGERAYRSLFVGGVYHFRLSDVRNIEQGGQLATQAYPGVPNSRLSALGATISWDSRNSTLSPVSGLRITATPRIYHRWLGSEYSFARLSATLHHYTPLPHDHVLAAELQLDLRSHSAPVDFLSEAGGPGLLRGMVQGRFRDRHFVGGQLEYRAPVWWRFGAVAFVGLGRVAHELSDFDIHGIKYSAGAGLRFALKPDKRINVRADFGVTNDQSGLYIDIMEAF